MKLQKLEVIKLLKQNSTFVWNLKLFHYVLKKGTGGEIIWLTLIHPKILRKNDTEIFKIIGYQHTSKFEEFWIFEQFSSFRPKSIFVFSFKHNLCDKFLGANIFLVARMAKANA